MKKIILFVCSMVIIVSCKNDRKNDSSIESTIEKEEMHSIEVYIDAIVPKDDVFEVYFYEYGAKEFKGHDFVYARVEGSTEVQTIGFTLPKYIYPERLRLDFGKNLNQGVIKWKNLRIQFGDKFYDFSKDELGSQFFPSKFINFDAETLTIQTKEIEGRYDPYFYTVKLNNLINYLIED